MSIPSRSPSDAQTLGDDLREFLTRLHDERAAPGTAAEIRGGRFAHLCPTDSHRSMALEEIVREAHGGVFCHSNDHVWYQAAGLLVAASSPPEEAASGGRRNFTDSFHCHCVTWNNLPQGRAKGPTFREEGRLVRRLSCSSAYHQHSGIMGEDGRVDKVRSACSRARTISTAR